LLPMSDRIHYICNAGVLVESGGKKVLVDGLINHNHPVFDRYSPQLEERIINADPPFDGLDLVLVTHFHSDHFDRHIMASFCRANPQVPVVGSPQVISLLRAELPVDANLLELNPARYGYERLEVNGVDFCAVSLLHSGKEYADAINLGYVLHLGKTFVHTGDAVNSRQNMEALVQAGAGAGAVGSGAAGVSGPAVTSGAAKNGVAANNRAGNSGLAEAATGEVSYPGASSRNLGFAPDALTAATPRGPVVITPFPYLTLPLAFKKFRSLLEPECMFVLHLPREHKDPGGWLEAVHKAWNKQRDDDLRIILAKHEGDVFNV
ncbi:MBL fold metallo-hydrolase, partial [Desulfovibrio sp. OttesenSCG-928-C06]|nr:MBL fold metallo-hydrolase [Desulfovibrio sp. OttesenSCG-928-C06]